MQKQVTEELWLAACPCAGAGIMLEHAASLESLKREGNSGVQDHSTGHLHLAEGVGHGQAGAVRPALRQHNTELDPLQHRAELQPSCLQSLTANPCAAQQAPAACWQEADARGRCHSHASAAVAAHATKGTTGGRAQVILEQVQPTPALQQTANAGLCGP